MAIFTLWALGAAVVGLLVGVGFGLITGTITGLVAKFAFPDKRLPFNWSENVAVPILACAGVGAVAGYVVGMIDSFNDSSFTETATSTILWSLIGPVLGFLAVFFTIVEENKLEKVILTHPAADNIFQEIIQEHANARELADEDETVERTDSIKLVMARYGLVEVEETATGVQSPLQ